MTTGPRLSGSAALTTEVVDRSGWILRARALREEGWWFEGLWPRRGPEGGVVACWGRRGQVALLELPCPTGSYPSLTHITPAADWSERAARDQAGLVPEGHVDPRAFRFHEAYPAGHVDGGPLPAWSMETTWSYPFLVHEGPGVFEIPVGPIHAGIIEPGHFRFTTVGELILDLEIRLNYTHKGTLALARGKPLEHATRLLERLSGDNAAAHACAFAAATEAALAIEVPPPIQRARTLLVEMERLHDHLFDLYGIALVTAYAAGAAHFHALREECMRWNARLWGHRLLMNAVAPGGLHRVPRPDDVAAYAEWLPTLHERFEWAVAAVTGNSGVKERIEETGRLSPDSAHALGCVGPAARATGLPRDARADAPCLAYPDLRIVPVTRTDGDVSSRMWVKIDEARATLALIRGGLLPYIDEARGLAPPPVPRGDGEGLAFVEASRGAVLSWVRVADGHVLEVHQRDPSFLNWRGLERAVLRNIVPDFPLINKSFNLSYSGSDA